MKIACIELKFYCRKTHCAIKHKKCFIIIFGKLGMYTYIVYIYIADSGILKKLLASRWREVYSFLVISGPYLEGYDQNWCFPDPAQVAVSV